MTLFHTVNKMFDKIISMGQSEENDLQLINEKLIKI